jgi:hypothetical protein
LVSGLAQAEVAGQQPGSCCLGLSCTAQRDVCRHVMHVRLCGWPIGLAPGLAGCTHARTHAPIHVSTHGNGTRAVLCFVPEYISLLEFAEDSARIVIGVPGLKPQASSYSLLAALPRVCKFAGKVLTPSLCYSRAITRVCDTYGCWTDSQTLRPSLLPDNRPL